MSHSSNHSHPRPSVTPHSSTQQKARSYRQDGYWFFQLAGGLIFGPFDKVHEAVMKDREFEERELDKNEATRLLLQFA